MQHAGRAVNLELRPGESGMSAQRLPVDMLTETCRDRYTNENLYSSEDSAVFKQLVHRQSDIFGDLTQ